MALCIRCQLQLEVYFEVFKNTIVEVIEQLVRNCLSLDVQILISLISWLESNEKVFTVLRAAGVKFCKVRLWTISNYLHIFRSILLAENVSRTAKRSFSIPTRSAGFAHTNVSLSVFLLHYNYAITSNQYLPTVLLGYEFYSL